ncbi:MAG: DUF4258 domain-containing protein [Leptolyngbya sp. SIOISBB]|nr:DUF4258 domain-containing protein [Leptolyngbya sp. SIOISBB]
MGRFLSEDPIGFDAGDANLYRYVFNSPTNYTDPTGEAAFVPLIIVGAGKAAKVIGAGAAAKAVGAGAVVIGAGVLALNNYEALEDVAQWCLETVTGGYNPDLDPNRANRDRSIPPATYPGEILQAPPMNPEDLFPGGFGTGPQPQVEDFLPMPDIADDLGVPFFEIGDASTPVGRRIPIGEVGPDAPQPGSGAGRHNPQHYNPPYQQTQNEPAIIDGRPYSGHAQDQMRNRGLTPSVVENTIRTGRRSDGRFPGTTEIYDSTNNVTVVINDSNGRVITAY